MENWFQKTRKRDVQPLMESDGRIPRALREIKSNHPWPLASTLFGLLRQGHGSQTLHDELARRTDAARPEGIDVEHHEVGPYIRYEIHATGRGQKIARRIEDDWHRAAEHH